MPAQAPTSSIQSYIGNAASFPILSRWLFMNHAGVAPIPQRAADAIANFAREAAESAYMEGHWHRQIEQLRTLAAGLINATREEIALVKNTSEGLAIVASGVNWNAGDRIVTSAVEYPSNAYPWIDLSKRLGTELVCVPERVRADGARVIDLDELLAAADHPRTRMVTLSHVEFGSGFRNDLAAIGRFCRQRGILFCVDAIQSLGVLPLNAQAMNIDFLSADGHKWLLGPEGAGIFYCRRELIEQTHPPLIGWMNVVGALDFDHIDFRLRPDAGRFECGSFNVPGFLGLKASIELLREAGLAAVTQRVKILTDRLAAGLRGKGYAVASARDGES
jgi:selenocysteine lyase/cysteine desulfurase